jgi:hypothetical protein
VASDNDLDLTKSSTDALDQSFDEPQTIFEASENEEDWNANLDAILQEYDQEISQESRVDMTKRFLSETIKENLGLKRFFLQRKVQKARTLMDLHHIRRPYISAILNAKGKDLAIELRDQFDQRMYISFSVDDPEFLDD